MTRKKFWRARNIIILSVIVIVAVGGIFAYIKAKNSKTLKTAIIERGEVISEVSVTGKVVPIKNIDLAFEKGGRIQKIYVEVGNKISKGQKLVELENSDFRAQVSQAWATVRSQQATLDSLLAGTRPEQITIKESELEKAQKDLDNLYGSIKDILDDAYAKSDDAVRTKIADLFTNADTTNPKLTFQTSNPQAEIDVLTLRFLAGTEILKWRSELAALPYSASEDDLLKALQSARSRTEIVSNLLTRALDAVDYSTNLSETTKGTYKLNIYTARTNVNSVRSLITSKEQSISSQKTTVIRIQNELALQKAGSTKEQIDVQKALVDQATANAYYTQSQLDKTIIYSPFSGIVTKVNNEVGDIVNANDLIISLIGAGKFGMEANIAESDIAKVGIKDSARVTLDAYGKSVVFEALITQINLSETIIEGVATYKTEFQFIEDDERILSGLTANIDILSEKKENVLYVPTRNILIEDDGQFVTKVDLEDEEEKVLIKTGLRGSDGRTEVISGLSEGDRILVE